MPVHGEGSPVWKELSALRDYVMDPEGYARMKWNSDIHSTDTLELKVKLSQSNKVAEHVHEVYLEDFEVKQAKGGVPVIKTTSVQNGHSHTLDIRWDARNKWFIYNRCDSKRRCWDNHPRVIDVVTDDNEVTV